MDACCGTTSLQIIPRIQTCGAYRRRKSSGFFPGAGCNCNASPWSRRSGACWAKFLPAPSSNVGDEGVVHALFGNHREVIGLGPLARTTWSFAYGNFSTDRRLGALFISADVVLAVRFGLFFVDCLCRGDFGHSVAKLLCAGDSPCSPASDQIPGRIAAGCLRVPDPIRLGAYAWAKRTYVDLANGGGRRRNFAGLRSAKRPAHSPAPGSTLVGPLYTVGCRKPAVGPRSRAGAGTSAYCSSVVSSLSRGGELSHFAAGISGGDPLRHRRRSIRVGIHVERIFAGNGLFFPRFAHCLRPGLQSQRLCG